MKKIIIFLGPSLPLSLAKQRLDALYLPPAQQADLISAVVNYQPDIIGLIDGVFYHSPSVWHKEILYAIEQGVTVYGASSMGALRAAETATFGMIGIGEIYQQYASGKLLDDDEVAVIHASQEGDFRPLSEPMINVRATLNLAVEQKIIAPENCQELLKIAKSIYFPERNWQNIFTQAKKLHLNLDQFQKLTIFVKENYVDIKQQDAILLLDTLRNLPQEHLPSPPQFKLARTPFFEAIYHRERSVNQEASTCPLGIISSYFALHSPDFEQTNFNALNRALVQVLAKLLNLEISPEAVEQESYRFRVKHKLTKPEVFREWLTNNNFTPEAFK